MELLATHTVIAHWTDQSSDIPHFFLAQKMVADYNNIIINNSAQYKMMITAIDVTPSTISESFKEQLMLAVLKCSK